jgi:defect-in-organelle-trafficking protein DotB
MVNFLPFSWPDAGRRDPTDIVVGECRDPESMAMVLQAVISGHPGVTTSFHAMRAVLTMQRIAGLGRY